MIEVVLDAAQNFVIDDILIAQLNNRPALHIERVLLQSLVGGREQSIRAISARTRAYFQLPDAVVVFSTKSLHDVCWKLAIDFPKVSLRRFIRFQPRRSFFHICEAIIHHSKPANQHGQTQTLEHERRENRAKGDEQNVVASGESAAVRKRRWHRERSSERYNAARPCPGNNRHVLPCRIRVFLRKETLIKPGKSM